MGSRGLTCTSTNERVGCYRRHIGVISNSVSLDQRRIARNVQQRFRREQPVASVTRPCSDTVSRRLNKLFAGKAHLTCGRQDRTGQGPQKRSSEATPPFSTSSGGDGSLEKGKKRKEEEEINQTGLTLHPIHHHPLLAASLAVIASVSRRQDWRFLVLV